MPGPLAALGLQLGSQAASQTISGIQGQIFGKMDDRRQFQLQEKLQQLGIHGQQQMVDYNYAKQLQMWKDTNYQAQMEQLEKAGLNPGLLYGMSGGGGATTGTPVGGTGAAQAGRGAGQVGMGMNVAELMLLKAQKENIEADTKKKEVETAKTSGVDTAKTEAETKLLQTETEIKNLELSYNKETFEQRVHQLNILTDQALEQLQIMRTQKRLDLAQYSDKIENLKAEISQKLVQNALTSQKITESQEQINKWAEEIKQAWANIDINQQRTDIERAVQQIKAKYPAVGQVLGRILNETAEGIGKLFGQKPDTVIPQREK